MRRLVWLVLLAALMWSGWWFFAATSLQRGIGQWFMDREQEGWQAEAVDVTVSGYPFRLEAFIDRPALADPDTGVAIEASRLDISAPAWWPGFVTMTLPSDDILLATPRERLTLRTSDATADLRLKPGPDLVLEQMVLSSGPWSLSGQDGSLWQATGLSIDLIQDDMTPEQYHFRVNAPAFQPGSIPRRSLRIPSDWPVAFDSLTLDISVAFDRVLDRSVVEVARAQPRRIEMRVAEAHWGSLLMRANAELDVSEMGLLSGEFSLQARNWRQMLSIAEASGSLPTALRPQLENILAALARGSGSPESIDVTLSLQDGAIALGFIPLGRIPPLVIP